METAGAYPFAALAPLLPYLDLVLFDVKLADPARHARYTGRDIGQIRDTLRRLLARGAAVEVRMPVVPGVNTDAAAVTALARLLTGLGVHALTLLPYNHLWEAKLPRLDTDRVPLGITPPPAALYAELSSAFSRAGVRASL
jgi:pyruvate formate lyase activating enzyme